MFRLIEPAWQRLLHIDWLIRRRGFPQPHAFLVPVCRGFPQAPSFVILSVCFALGLTLLKFWLNS